MIGWIRIQLNQTCIDSKTIFRSSTASKLFLAGLQNADNCKMQTINVEIRSLSIYWETDKNPAYKKPASAFRKRSHLQTGPKTMLADHSTSEKCHKIIFRYFLQIGRGASNHAGICNRNVIHILQLNFLQNHVLLIKRLWLNGK